MRPLEALEEAIGKGILFHRRKTFEKPGSIVASMAQETREALSKLTSADTLKVRTDLIDGDEGWIQREWISKMLRDFDLRLIRGRLRS